MMVRKTGLESSRTIFVYENPLESFVDKSTISHIYLWDLVQGIKNESLSIYYPKLAVLENNMSVEQGKALFL